MSASHIRIRKHPDRTRAHAKAICAAESMRDKTIFSRMSTFSGKNAMSPEQLDYMLRCAKETREKKTW